MEPSQKPLPRRTQAERREATRSKLIDVARELFVTSGYAETGTPEIVAAADVTRGALYHHFADKTDLFRAVCAREADFVGTSINDATGDIDDAASALVAGSLAYFDAMSVPGRAALLLVEAPAVVGHVEAANLALGDGRMQLREGVAQALPDAGAAEIDALTDILSAAFDRTALAIAEGGDKDAYVNAMLRLVDRTTSP